MKRLALAVLGVLLLAAGQCAATRALQQADGTAAAPSIAPAAAASPIAGIPDAAGPIAEPVAAPVAGVLQSESSAVAAPEPDTLTVQRPTAAAVSNIPLSAGAAAPTAETLIAQGPAAVAVSNIQLNAPGTGNLLSAPALAPAAAPLPPGIVSLAAKRKFANKAAQTEGELAQDMSSPGTQFVAATPTQGEYSTIAGIDNTGKGLPAGFSNKPLSASQLAAIQAASVKRTHSDAATVATPNAGTSDGGPQQVVVHPTDMSRNTVSQVNAAAPTYQVSKSLSVKPRLATASGMDSRQGNSGKETRTGQATAGKKESISGAASTGATTTPVTIGGRTVNVFIPTIGNPEEATGDYISGIVGVRIATPLFGTGFNFCIDRYFGSFPKVGIVIPNAAAWLLPEFQDLANVLEHTLDLPSILPHGARVDPTADGFLIWLPTFQPSQLPEFGIRYGIQIGQAFGYDFGIGIVKEICFVSFVIV